jgi:hypothetical protein
MGRFIASFNRQRAAIADRVGMTAPAKLTKTTKAA